MGTPGHLLIGECSKNAYLAKNVRNCNSEEKFLLLTNSRHLSFNNMGVLLLFPMKVHINESSMVNILSFAEVANIAGVHIKMYMSKGKVINVHIEDGKSFNSKHVQRVFSTPTLMTPP